MTLSGKVKEITVKTIIHGDVLIQELNMLDVCILHCLQTA